LLSGISGITKPPAKSERFSTQGAMMRIT